MAIYILLRSQSTTTCKHLLAFRYVQECCAYQQIDLECCKVWDIKLPLVPEFPLYYHRRSSVNDFEFTINACNLLSNRCTCIKIIFFELTSNVPSVSRTSALPISSACISIN